MLTRPRQFLVKYLRAFYSQYNHKIIYNMKVVYFRHRSDENRLQINFHYTNPMLKIDRDFNFSRDVNENISLFLDRMKNNIEKEVNKKSKKKKNKGQNSASNEANSQEDASPTEVAVAIDLIKQNRALSRDVTFASLLDKSDINDLVLRVNDQDFQVAYNTPWVENIALPTSILAGFLIYPNKLDLHFADKKCCKGIWYKGVMPKDCNIKNIQWEKVHEGLSYLTTTSDVGHILRLELIPGNGQLFGPAAESISKSEVQAGPGICPFENRHLYTLDKLIGNMFRVTSYNILADLYADSDHSRTVLFPYCPPYALNIDYRKQLFLKEILGYNSDIICLQEVDSKIYDLDLNPMLETLEYLGHFQQKGKSGEGVATFYNSRRFEFVNKYGFNIGEEIPRLEIFTGLREKIQKNQKLMDRIVARSTAVQITVLRSIETDNVLIVANTHLYFHPDSDHIRLLQVGFSMLYVEHVYEKTRRELQISKDKLSVIFCGDFNSVPECGIYKLMTENFVDKNFIDWRSNEEEAVEDVVLHQPFKIQSACGCPKYTNFTHLFAACLDYIFYQTDNLQVDKFVPLPSEEELRTHIAIPSVVFPSDHIALVADLMWKNR